MASFQNRTGLRDLLTTIVSKNDPSVTRVCIGREYATGTEVVMVKEQEMVRWVLDRGSASRMLSAIADDEWERLVGQVVVRPPSNGEFDGPLASSGLIGHQQIVTGEGVELDIGIAPLVEALWSKGIETYASCEDAGSWGEEWNGPPGMAYIVLDRDDARRFRQKARRGTVDPAIRLLDIGDELPEQGVPSNCMIVCFPTDRIGELTAKFS